MSNETMSTHVRTRGFANFQIETETNEMWACLLPHQVVPSHTCGTNWRFLFMISRLIKEKTVNNLRFLWQFQAHPRMYCFIKIDKP